MKTEKCHRELYRLAVTSVKTTSHYKCEKKRSKMIIIITQFLPGSGHIDTAIWMHYMDANKTAGEETRWQLHKNAACNPQQVLTATPHKTPTVRPPAPYHENYSS